MFSEVLGWVYSNNLAVSQFHKLVKGASYYINKLALAPIYVSEIQCFTNFNCARKNEPKILISLSTYLSNILYICRELFEVQCNTKKLVPLLNRYLTILIVL